MFCRNCGKEIDDKAVVCPHCGVPTDLAANFAVANGAEKKVNGFGIAGFVVGLLSLYLGIYFCIASIVGLVLSIVGLTQTKKYRLSGFAIAGLVLSIISLVIWGIIWLTMSAIIIGITGGVIS